MPGAYETRGLAGDGRELPTFGHEPTVDCGAIDLTGLSEAAELRDRARRLLGVGDHTPIEVQKQVAENARRLAQPEPPAHRWG